MKERHIPNPSGKGGFKDNPQNRNAGYWSPENSISYQYKKFLTMTVGEFKDWENSVPEEQRTVAQSLAFAAAARARTSLKDLRELTDRTEGRPQLNADITSNGETLNVALVKFIGDDDSTTN